MKKIVMCLFLVLFLSPLYAQGSTPVLAIPQLYASNVEPDEVRIAYNYIIDKVNKSGQFTIVERTALDKAIKELQLSGTDLIDATTAVKIGRFSGARFILISSLIKIEGVYHLSMRVVSVETGEITGTSAQKTDKFLEVEKIIKIAVGSLFSDEEMEAAEEKNTLSAPGSIASVPDGFVFVKGGTFQMGDTFKEGQEDETVHKVKVSSFYMGRAEVTFEEYRKFCIDEGKSIPSDNGWGKVHRPVINVSWFDALAYCNWLSEEKGYTPCYTISETGAVCDFEANGFRLPTEAEWEYAARERGKKVRFGNGKDIADPQEMNFFSDVFSEFIYPYSKYGEYRKKTLAVGAFKPNALGLYDMSGNVWEWCWDWYAEYSHLPQKDYRGPSDGFHRVLRGGGFEDSAGDCRAAHRYSSAPSSRDVHIGFRLVFVPSP